MSNGFQLRFVASCDHCDRRRKTACAAVEHVTGKTFTVEMVADSNQGAIGPKELRRFEKIARKQEHLHGWYFGAVTLCPRHNTSDNRKKKKFSLPEKGSPADIARRLREQ